MRRGVGTMMLHVLSPVNNSMKCACMWLKCWLVSTGPTSGGTYSYMFIDIQPGWESSGVIIW